MGLPSSVTPMVECPVWRRRASTSLRVASGRILESLETKPALNFLTRRTISACSAMGCEPKMKESPPLRASSMASVSLDTDCMIAETKGMLSRMRDSSPRAKRTSGVCSETFCGVHSRVVSPGIRRYSPKVRDTSFTSIAMMLVGLGLCSYLTLCRMCPMRSFLVCM